jgi:hypothetical protein
VHEQSAALGPKRRNHALELVGLEDVVGVQQADDIAA